MTAYSLARYNMRLAHWSGLMPPTLARKQAAYEIGEQVCRLTADHHLNLAQIGALLNVSRSRAQMIFEKHIRIYGKGRASPIEEYLLPDPHQLAALRKSPKARRLIRNLARLDAVRDTGRDWMLVAS